jgi:hypothetical protein
MAEKTIKFYAEEPVQMEWSPDGIQWSRVEHYDEAPAEGCMQATVDVETGWVRAKYLFNNAELYGTTSNNIAVPEAAGLWVGLIALCALGRRRRAR